MKKLTKKKNTAHAPKKRIRPSKKEKLAARAAAEALAKQAEETAQAADPEEETEVKTDSSSISEEQRIPEPTLVLEATLYTLDQLKHAGINVPQLAFVGRSNVGKSSLLNALARRRSLAKISATPGKTRSVNLFMVEPDGFCLTDLPGYGYARRGKEERKAWGKLIETYLIGTELLRGVVLLLDCRLPPQESDKLMAEFARAHGLPLIPILTKSDKCNMRERAARQKEWAVFLRGALPLPVSARTGLGIAELWAELRQGIAHTTVRPTAGYMLSSLTGSPLTREDLYGEDD